MFLIETFNYRDKEYNWFKMTRNEWIETKPSAGTLSISKT